MRVSKKTRKIIFLQFEKEANDDGENRNSARKAWQYVIIYTQQ